MAAKEAVDADGRWIQGVKKGPFADTSQIEKLQIKKYNTSDVQNKDDNHNTMAPISEELEEQNTVIVKSEFMGTTIQFEKLLNSCKEDLDDGGQMDDVGQKLYETDTKNKIFIQKHENEENLSKEDIRKYSYTALESSEILPKLSDLND